MHDPLLNHIQFHQADHYNLPRIRQFYKLNGMRAQAPKGDRVFYTTLDTKIIAALRLHPVNTCFLLRSMCVSKAHRQQGVGTKLLAYLQRELINIECYCFPYSHLQHFYTSANFTLCPVETAPQAISDKFTRYLNNGKDICLMKHHYQTMLK